jgi:D-tyrosyl-tRNA(Tyr) deacylase
MRALLQRVIRASVRFSGQEIQIRRGLVVFLGIGSQDSESEGIKLAEKCAQLRLFPNEQGKFDLSLLDVRGEALVVSQFTLYGDCRKGRRPEFTGAMAPESAERLYDRYVQSLRDLGVAVKTGKFGAHMEVELINDGPVTLWIDTVGKE